jgi:hypothetical protein
VNDDNTCDCVSVCNADYLWADYFFNRPYCFALKRVEARAQACITNDGEERMKTIIATSNKDSVIELQSAQAIEELYDLINDDENFILQWGEGSVTHSELIMTTNIAGKVKTGDLVIKAKSARKE